MGKSFQDQQTNLREALDMLRQYGLKLKYPTTIVEVSDSETPQGRTSQSSDQSDESGWTTICVGFSVKAVKDAQTQGKDLKFIRE